MARKKTDEKVSSKEEITEKVDGKPEQLQLFAAFRDIWQAPVP